MNTSHMVAITAASSLVLMHNLPQSEPTASQSKMAQDITIESRIEPETVYACCAMFPAPPSPRVEAARHEREAFAKTIAFLWDSWQSAHPDKSIHVTGATVSAQWMLESNWGRSKLYAEAKNFGGIKGAGWHGMTAEHVQGRWVVIEDGFRSYTSLEDFFVDYASLISRLYPAAVGQNGREFYTELKLGGYATDPNYENICTSLYNQIR